MQAFVWLIFVALFFVLKLVLKGTGKVVDIAADAYKTVNNSNHSSGYNKSSYQERTTFTQSNPAKIYCIDCGTTNDNDSKFCIKCGKPMVVAKQQSSQSKPQNPFEDTIFGCAITLVAYVAKADGVISANEAEVIGMLLSDMSSGDDSTRRALKSIYDEAKNAPVRNHNDIARKMSARAKHEFSLSDREEYYMIFIKWLVILVYADNSKNTKQNTVVDDIASILQIDKGYLAGLHRKFDNSSKQEYSQNNSSAPTIDDHYKTLKCKPSDSDDDIKKAYRELAKQYHPDTINSKGLAEDFILFANQKFKEINCAYDAVKKYRGMK